MANPSYPCLGVPVDQDCPQTPTYPARECTSGAAWWGSAYTGKQWPKGWGNAENWPAAARAAGFRVDLTPEPDSIMCIPAWTNGSGAQGHVAYVTGEPQNGRVAVIEMNFLIEHGYDFRSASISGCEFIHLTPKSPPVPQPKPTPGALMKATFFQGPDSTFYLFVPTGKGQFIPLNEMAVVKALAADWGISETPIQLNAVDVAAWRAAYPQGA